MSEYFAIINPTDKEVTIPLDVYEKLKQDSKTLARIKEYVNNLDKE